MSLKARKGLGGDRGEVNFLTVVLALAFAVGVYFAWVYLPMWLDHQGIKKAVRTGGNMAYANRMTSVVKDCILNGFKEAAIENYEVALDGSVIHRPLVIDDQNMEIRLLDGPPPSVIIDVQYERRIVLPLFKKPRTVKYSYHHEVDLTDVVY